MDIGADKKSSNENDEKSTDQPCIKRVQFHLQRGSSFELSEQKVHDFFSKNYGQVKTVGYNSSSGKGTVEFASEIEKNMLDKEIEIGDCSVYTCRRIGDLSEESVQTQILLESQQLPVGWERSMILRNHFEKFGKVAGVVFIGSRDGNNRAIIGFEDKETVERLVGVTEIINGSKVDIQRVNSETVKWNK